MSGLHSRPAPLDQADGLRRMLARTPMRLLAVASMLRGMGVTSVVMIVAAALAQQGRQLRSGK